jgi:hypothetical protein
MLLPDESNTDASRRSIGGQAIQSVFNELVRVICSKTARLQTATETFGYTRVYEVIIVDLTQSRRYAFAPFSSQTRKLRDATAAQPRHVQEGERR